MNRGRRPYPSPTATRPVPAFVRDDNASTLAGGLNPDSPVVGLPGIGPKRAAALARRGIATAQDIILTLPSRYQDWRTRLRPIDLKPGTVAVVEGKLTGISERPMPGARWRWLATGWISDGAAGQVRVVWFNLPAYVRGRLPQGERVAAYGRVTTAPDGILEIVHPELRRLSEGTGRPLRAVYSLPEEVSQRLYSNLVSKVLDRVAPKFRGALPDELREAAGLPTFAQALIDLHCPSPNADLAALQSDRSEAHRALALDEMFAFQLALLIERVRKSRRAAAPLTGEPRLTPLFVERLPFELTRSQKNAFLEIGTDCAQPTQMNRLLMGDVGSGKTLVAFWAALRAIESGYQAVMMAPTELLAEQHHASFERLCGSLGVTAALLTGKVTGARRAALLRALGWGEISMLFGTQALIQEGVRTAQLGLCIIDEQHRFGVFERARVKTLGSRAHVLLMTATPIPRSFALMLFANLDLSTLDETPPGHTPAATSLFDEGELDAVDEIVRKELVRGNRAYYVLPLIEGEEEDVPSVEAMVKRLARGALRQFRVGSLHGRMPSVDKGRVMREFRDGVLDVLVSTTVVEVGIDVPEATAIVIMAAERYGLAQLHQLRGRVGRGAAPSRCFLVLSRDADEQARTRLRLLAESHRGAEVARADLEMRGPGDLLGARQSGALPLRFARFIGDYSVIEQSRKLAEQWFARDPELMTDASRGCRSAITRMLNQGFSLGDVG